MSSQNPDHGLVFMPCTEIGHIRTTRHDSTIYGPIASVDLGGGVSMHIHTAEGARELLGAALQCLRILDPEMASLFDDPFTDDVEDEPEQVMYGGVPLDVAQPEDIPVGLYPAYLAPVPDPAPLRTCWKCGRTDTVSVSHDGACWNTQNCAARVAGKAAAQ